MIDFVCGLRCPVSFRIMGKNTFWATGNFYAIFTATSKQTQTSVGTVHSQVPLWVM